MQDLAHSGHKDSQMAYHVPWDFRPEAIFLSNKPPTMNFWALATNLRDWMTQQDQLRYSTSYEKPDRFANPHTQAGALLNVVYATVLNEAHSFANDRSAIDAVEAEIKRVRLNTDLTLYSARICECHIKQLVFLTTLAYDSYDKASLGELLTRWCTSCGVSNNKKRHRMSLLGSLSHRYHLCHEYEGCLAVRTRMVNRRRNFEAAHSGVMKFYPKDAKHVRRKFKGELQRSSTDFLHVLNHIADIEQRIIEELPQHQIRLAFSSPHPQLVALAGKGRKTKTGKPK